MPQLALQICNSALLKIGGRVIPSFGYTGTKEGELVTERFDKCLGMLTRDHVWSCFKKVVQLTSTTPTLVTPWLWIHDLPPDFSRILHVTVGGSHIETERMGNQFYAYYDIVDLRYVFQVTDFATFQFEDDFAEALATYLGSDIAMSLTQSPEMKQQCLQQFGDLLRMARFNGAVERSSYALTACEWVDSRQGYDTGNPYPLKLA